MKDGKSRGKLTNTIKHDQATNTFDALYPRQCDEELLTAPAKIVL
jgi:hypothetical protein